MWGEVGNKDRKKQENKGGCNMEEARRLLEAVLDDPRVKDLNIKGCLDCGACVNVCPGARFCGPDVQSGEISGVSI